MHTGRDEVCVPTASTSFERSDDGRQVGQASRIRCLAQVLEQIAGVARDGPHGRSRRAASVPVDWQLHGGSGKELLFAQGEQLPRRGEKKRCSTGEKRREPAIGSAMKTLVFDAVSCPTRT